MSLADKHRVARPVAVLGGVRIPFCRNNTAYVDVGNLGMSIRTLGALVERYGLHGQVLGEVAMGAVIKHASDWNLAREAVLSSGLSPLTPGITLQRACGTGLDTIITVANKIALGQIEAGIGGGSDTTSDVPIVYGPKLRARFLALNRSKSLGEKLRAFRGFRFRELKPEAPGVAEPRTGKSMGDHCEMMAKEWHIPRESQDEIALASHRKAAAAYERGFYADLVASFRGLERDTILRADTTLEKLAALKPAFDRSSGQGTLTAGNSTPLTDGASACLLASDAWATAHGLEPLAYLRDAEVAAVDRARRRPADGADHRGAAHARTQWADPAGLRLLRDPRGVRSAGVVHVASVGIGRLLPEETRARRAWQHRSCEDERGRFLARARAPISRDRRAHRCDCGEAAERKRIRPRVDLDLYGGWNGSGGDSGALRLLNNAGRAAMALQCACSAHPRHSTFDKAHAMPMKFARRALAFGLLFASPSADARAMDGCCPTLEAAAFRS
jgi:acetyl-CoA acetyltransferase family protein